MQIAPSILNADFRQLQTDVNSVSSADRIHLDVMDGNYVPSITFGAAVLSTIEWPCETEVHLMTMAPERHFDAFVALGCTGITFHIESTGADRAVQLLQRLNAMGVRAGIAIDGHTSADWLSDEILKIAGQVLVMSVKSGAGGQSFMPESVDKVRSLRARGYTREIEIDGGINLQTAPLAAAAGGDIAVVGSAIMRQPAADRSCIITQLQGA